MSSASTNTPGPIKDDHVRHLLALRLPNGRCSSPIAAGRRLTLIARVIAGAPLCDFTAVDAVQHTIWKVDSLEEHQLVVAFDAVGLGTSPMAIIEPRARRVRGVAGASRARGDWDWFLAVAFPDVQLLILPYSRVVKDLAGMTPDTFITALRQRFAIETARRHRQGEARSQCSSAAGGTPSSSMRTSRTRQPAPGRTRLQDAVLAPLLGIGDVRTDKRIDFVGAQRCRGAGVAGPFRRGGRCVFVISGRRAKI